MQPSELKVSSCYSNGGFGNTWSVWQIVDISSAGTGTEENVRYKVLVGENRRKYFVCTREEFAGKVRYEVSLVENSWQRVE
jgi:hypothetical protein